MKDDAAWGIKVIEFGLDQSFQYTCNNYYDRAAHGSNTYAVAIYPSGLLLKVLYFSVAVGFMIKKVMKQGTK